jgi:hypothetical protein
VPSLQSDEREEDETEEPQLNPSQELCQLVNHLHRLLTLSDFAADSLSTVSLVLGRVAEFPHLDSSVMDAVCGLLKSLARRSLSEALFDSSGTCAVFNIVEQFAGPACRLGSASCLLVFNKLVEVYVARNAACAHRRLSPGLLDKLLSVIGTVVLRSRNTICGNRSQSRKYRYLLLDFW